MYNFKCRSCGTAFNNPATDMEKVWSNPFQYGLPMINVEVDVCPHCESEEFEEGQFMVCPLCQATGYWDDFCGDLCQECGTLDWSNDEVVRMRQALHNLRQKVAKIGIVLNQPLPKSTVEVESEI